MAEINSLHNEISSELVADQDAVRRERGAAMVEYALLLALIAIVAIGAITAFGGGLGGEFSSINSEIAVATNS